MSTALSYRLVQLRKEGYYHCDAHQANVLVKDSTKEECEQLRDRKGPSVFMALTVPVENPAQTCRIIHPFKLWLIDPAFMTKAASPVVYACDFLDTDLSRILSPWHDLKAFALQDGIINWPKPWSWLLRQVFAMINLNYSDSVLKSHMLPADETRELYRVFQGFKEIRRKALGEIEKINPVTDV